MSMTSSDASLLKSMMQGKDPDQEKHTVRKLLKGLNPQQTKAVKATKGEVAVMAGAGSGKTRVLTRRVAYLIAHDHVNPGHILAVTFTNKASKEMKDRINQLLHFNNAHVTVSTFHAFGFHLLHQCLHYFPHLLDPYDKYFGITLPSTQKTAVKHIMRDKLDISKDEMKPADAISAISKYKNNMKSVHQVKLDNDKIKTPIHKHLSEIYDLYQRKLKSDDQMDFDDLLLYPVLILEKHPKIRKIYQKKFQYVSVDEYQDVNSLQRYLLQLITARSHNLFVVGDINQSIYSWRGSKPQYLLHFKDYHPSARVIYMTQNYRSTKNILKVSNAVIRNNKNRTKIDAFTDNPAGKPVHLYAGASNTEEANFVMAKIKELHRKGIQYNQIAILYRTNFQSRLFEEVLFNHGVPNKVLNSTGFYQRKEILDMLAYLQLLVNSKNNPAFLRVVNVPKRHIGKASVKKLSAFADANHMSLLQASKHVQDCKTLGNAPKKHIYSFYQIIHDLGDHVHKMSVANAIKMTIDRSGYEQKLHDQIHNGKDIRQNKNRLMNLNELISAGAEYDEQKQNTVGVSQRLSHYLSYVALMSDQDDDNKNVPKVKLMTLHAAKGMEFPVVFLVGMVQGVLPLSFQGQISNMEEERRLCYVGMTRAEKQLYLSYGREMRFRGQLVPNDPSDFIKEIPPKLLRPCKYTMPIKHHYHRRFYY